MDFLHADKHQTFLQVDHINLGGHGQACPNYSKITSSHNSFCLIYQERSGGGWGMKFIFLCR